MFQNKEPSKYEVEELIRTFNNGQYAKALRSSLRMTSVFPSFQIGWKCLGALMRQDGRLMDAIVAMEKSVELIPTDSEAHSNLGATLRDAGRLEAAQNRCRKAISLDPKNFKAHHNLGNALKDLGQLNQAVESYQRALALKPDFPEAHNNLANTLKELGRFIEAEFSCRQAISLKADLVEAHINLANTLRDLGRLAESEASCQFAIALRPDNAQAHNNYAATLIEQGRLKQAQASCRQAIALKPDLVQAHVNLGNVLRDHGRLTEAQASYRQAIELRPELSEAHSNLLLAINYTEEISNESRLSVARHFGELFSKKTTAKFSEWECLKPLKKLKIGFVSGDLREHPVGDFLEGLLSNIDASKFELIAYSTQFAEDALTQKIKPFFKHWRSLLGKSDEAAAKLIHEDAPHILIDLAGHTAHNRLPIFAYKPAPIQVSWLGYFATTGLPEMDYILGDPYVTPESEAHHFSEKIWRLPETYLCFTPPQQEVEVKPLPALVNGFITFGCFNNLTKLNDAVLALWAKVLTALPNAKVFLKNKQLADNFVVQNTIQRFERVGVTADRLILEGPSARADYFESYNKVDIALDPFPFPGGTTSVEGLWMGVPVVTLKGERFISHNGQTIAHNAGQANWVAKDADDYVRLALEAALDIEKLARIRAGLRAQVLASPLLDAPRFTRNFEAAMLGMAPTGFFLTPICPDIQDAMALHQQGQLDRAADYYRQILTFAPRNAETLHLLGVIAYQTGKYQEAIELIDQAIAINPNVASYHSNRGNALKALKQLDAAVASYDKAISLNPDFADAYYSQGVVLQGLKKLDAAVASYDKAISLKPDDADAYYNQGVALQELRQLDAAVASYDNVIALKPDYAQAFSNKGAALLELKKFEEAIANFATAIAIKPDYVEAYSNRGIALKELKQLGAAVSSFDRALSLKPDYAEAYWNKSLCLLLAGRFLESWGLYEWRWETKEIGAFKRNFSQPLWLGAQSLVGKTILLHAEQGLGDTIQFCRYTKMVEALGARVVLEVQKPLMRLLKDLPGISSLIAYGEPLPEFNFHCPLLSLPLAFKTDLKSIPCANSYLAAEPQRVAHWKRRLQGDALRIGVSWQGSQGTKIDIGRSFDLSLLQTIAELPNVQLVSLQKAYGSEQLKNLPQGMQVLDLGEELDADAAFLDTAAVMMNLDLVITCDTAIGHLAGALGIKVWLALKFVPDWRWMLDRTDSPWYPSVSLYRQQKIDDWTPVFEQMRMDLTLIEMKK